MAEVDFQLEDCYTILGLDIKDKRLYTERTIKKAFRRMALKYHPDRNKEEFSERQFKLIFLSYQEVLADMGIEDSKATKRKSPYDNIYNADGFNVKSYRSGWQKHAELFEEDLHKGVKFGNERPIGYITDMGWSYFDEQGRFHGHPYKGGKKPGIPMEKLRELLK